MLCKTNMQTKSEPIWTTFEQFTELKFVNFAVIVS